MDSLARKPTSICQVVAIPWPGRGHINPMMNLCRSLVTRKHEHHQIFITFVVTEEWSELLTADPASLPDNVRLTTIPNVLMSEKTRAGKFPAFYQEVMTKMEEPVVRLIDRFESSSVTAIIADTFLTWAVDIANRRNIPVGSFWTMSSPVYAVFHHFDLLINNGHYPVDLKERGEEIVDYIPGVSPTRLAEFSYCFNGGGREVLHWALPAITKASKAQFHLFCSIYGLEAQTLEALKPTISSPMYHVGPTIPYYKLDEPTGRNDADYFRWLDKQPKSSVLYVSQGSHHSAADAQVEELAAGLRVSGVKYFWVARGETSKYQSGCGEDGVLVSWCDQLRVLSHPSVGGFWSHCGWNSTAEAAFSGVPVLTFPLYWDQMQNAELIVENWKMGLRGKSGIDADKLKTREEIGGIIKRFMDAENEEVKEMRRRASEVREICRRAVQKDGPLDANINGLINEMVKYRN